ncbi:MAG: transglycosylase family protein [Actinomycetaceae bacterium]|nr:transglycosylase family protein [Actinomycetaceae bacterium]
MNEIQVEESVKTPWATQAAPRTIKAIAGATAAVLLTAMGGSIAVSHTEAVVEADGLTRPVTLWGGSVADALSAAKVEVGDYDKVSANLHSRVTDGQVVSVERAQLYRVNEDGKMVDFWSIAPSLTEAMNVLKDSGRDGNLAAQRSTARGELPSLSEAKTQMQVQVDGKTQTVEVPAGATVPQVLEAAGVNVSPIDEVHMTVGGEGPALSVTRIKRGYTTEEKVIEFDVEERQTDELYEGETRVVTEGKEGSIVTTTYRELRDGKPVVEVLSSTKETKPVTQVVEKGTKERPAARPARPGRGTGSAPAGVWAALAQCESGGNPATNTGNGYYGLYQFSLPTWQSVGGSGLPSDASAAEQTMRAQMLQQRAGWGQWPACAASLGLL